MATSRLALSVSSPWYEAQYVGYRRDEDTSRALTSAAPPKCSHGVWTFAGSDARRGASKWRCPTGECSPASVWVKADRLHPLVPRTTTKFKALYHQRGAVEREFGYLKHEWALLPLRVRRIQRVTLHVNLTILGRLAFALDNAHEAPSEVAA